MTKHYHAPWTNIAAASRLTRAQPCFCRPRSHSLGAALATVAALDISVRRKLDPDFQGDKWDNISFAAYT